MKDILLEKLKKSLKENNQKDINDCLNLLYEEELYYDIIEHLEYAINNDIKNSCIYYSLGISYLQIKKYNKSIKYFYKTIEKLNNSMENLFIDFKSNIYNNIGIVYSYMKEFNKAIENFDKAIELRGNDPDYYFNRSMVYNDIKEYDKSIIDLEKAIKLDKESDNKNLALFYNAIAAVYGNKKDYKELISYCNKAISYVNSDDDETKRNIYFNKGTAYIELKEYDNAIICFDEAIKNTTPDNGIFVNKINALIYKKDYSEAIRCFKELMKSKDVRSTFSLFNNIYFMYKNKCIENKEFNDLLNKLIEHNITNIENDNIDILYKYRCFDDNDFSLELIREQKIRISDFNFFNDPADPPIKLDKGLFSDVYGTIKNIKIASLSSKFDNILMWSHYANAHKGFCIAYDMSNVCNNYEFKNRCCILKKVMYDDLITFNNSGFNIKYDPYIFNESNRIESSPPFIYLFYLKYIDWIYENEYRIISFDCKEDFINIPVKAVYIGKDAEEKDINKLKNILKIINKDREEQILLYKMSSKKDNLFELKEDIVSL